jgi:chloride channel protein, CIC family
MRGGKVVGLLVVGVAVGVADALVFLGFEWLVHDGTDWLWNDLFDSDDRRWVVVPLALVLGVGFSLVLRLLDQPRVPELETDLLSSLPTTATPRDIAVILAVGGASLLAGASLGPEAPLVGATAALGAWLAGRGRVGPLAPVVVLASVGALLVAFFGSYVLVLLPLLLLRQKGSLSPAAALTILATGGAAYLTIWAIKGEVEGFGTIPTGSDVEAHDFVAALVVGAVFVVVALGVRWGIDRVGAVARSVDGRMPWPLVGALFGVVLGGLYLLGGQTVEFSGSEGTPLLVERASTYAAPALAGLLVVKVLVTAWSLGTGYRGGLVFPSVYMGVALGLLTANLASGLAGPGVLVGGVAGVFTAMLGPAFAVVALVAMLPLDLLPLAVLGVVGAAVGQRVVGSLGPQGAGQPDAGAGDGAGS